MTIGNMLIDVFSFSGWGMSDFDHDIFSATMKTKIPNIPPRVLAIRSFISVALYKVNSWLISIINDITKVRKVVRLILL